MAGKTTGSSFMRALVCSGIFLCAFGLYLWCFQPAGSWGDGDDFSLCSYFLGVPHPTGYPAYVLIGKAASLVPVGSLGFRVGLLSSLFGALSAGMLFVFAARLAGSAATGFYAAVVLAGTSFFWSQSIAVEAYSLNVFFFLAVAILFLGRGDVRAALLFFPLAAFGLGNHGTLVVPAVFLGVVMLVAAMRGSRPGPGFAAVTFLVIMGLSVYLCLPLFSARSAVFDWNNPQFARNMPLLLSGYDFWVVGEYIPAQMWKNFVRLAGEVASQAAPAAALFFLWAALGRKLPWRDKGPLLAVFVVAGLFPILYPTREKESFFLLSYVLLLAFSAAGLAAAAAFAGAGRGRMFVGAAIVLIGAIHAGVLLHGNRSLAAERKSDTAERYADALFLSAQRDSLVLVDHLADDTLFPPVYSQFAGGLRPDVFVFHRLYLAFPWYMDAMRARGKALGSEIVFPKIDLKKERERNIAVTAEEKQRREAGKTMNTIAIDLLTVRLMQANRGVARVYINTPDRFKRSLISEGYEFAPDGALFRLGGSEGVPLPAVLDGAERSKEKVYRQAVKEIRVQRALYHEKEAVRAGVDKELRRSEFLRVAGELLAALEYGEDCGLRKVLAMIYRQAGEDAKAAEQEDIAAECDTEKYDIH